MSVFRRKVFYLPGYDPFPPRRYRELYRSEGAAQALISGYCLQMASKTGKGPYGWTVQGQFDGCLIEADFEVLIWSDIVKSSMSDGILATYGQLGRTAWIYLASGAFIRQMRLRKGPTIAALYPVMHLVGQVLIGGVLGALTAFALGLMHPLLSVLGLIVFGGFLRLAQKYDHKILAYYLMHDFAFSAQHWGAYPPALSARMDDFRARIRTSLTQNYDEVLIVGHSSGAYMGVTILADLLRETGAQNTSLSFLSLGQVVPMVSFLPRADRLRKDLHDLSLSDQITWVDVTAPGDGCALALCDPAAVTGVAPQGQKWPLVLPCAFTQTLSPERWKALRWKFFRLHFQYMCAFDRVGIYDYFAITAGPKTLAARFAEVPHSKSRITTPRSSYRSMA
jgi:hypothetical protein